MNGEGQCKRVSIISMRMVVSKWVNVSSIWFLHLARCSILWLQRTVVLFDSVYHLASVWITEPWCLPPLRANEWMSGTASVPTATCEWVKECKCAIVNVRPVYWAILSLWNQITMWLNEHPLSEDTSEWVSVCASLCVRLLLMTYSYPCSYIHLLRNLGASGMKTWWPDDMMTWWHDDMWHDPMMACSHDDMIPWWHVHMMTWSHDDMMACWHDDLMSWWWLDELMP